MISTPRWRSHSRVLPDPEAPSVGPTLRSRGRKSGSGCARAWTWVHSSCEERPILDREIGRSDQSANARLAPRREGERARRSAKWGRRRSSRSDRIRKPRERLCRRGGRKYLRGDFSPRRYDVHPQTRFRRLWEPSRKRRGRRFWILRGRSVPVHAAASALRPSKILQLGPRPLFWGKSVRRNSGLDGAQGAPMPLAPVVMVEFGESGFVTVGLSALRGDAPLRTAATANADPGTSQIIAVWAMTWPRS